MKFLSNLFGVPQAYECRTPEELESLKAEAQERMQTAKLTNKAFQSKGKILKANEQIAVDNLNYWGEFAKSKTNVAKALERSGKTLHNLAPKYVGAIGGAMQHDQQAQDEIAQLTAKYGNVSRGNGNSNPASQGLGLPGGF